MAVHEKPTDDVILTESSLTGEPQVDGYRILSLIAMGGFGEVFLAEQLEPVKRRVALKFIKPGMDSRAIIARFEAERQALALMDHPCVAKVLDAGMTSAGRPYFAMEHVQGERITAFCDRHKLPLRERLGLFLRVCDAVQHAHHKGIIHRDIKPSNILVRFEGDSPAPKVIDFGVAKALGQKLTDSTLFTEQGQVIGTPEYMSPEQAELSAVDVDTRTDIYSLGVLLYEILTGALPFDSDTLRSAGFNEVQRIIREVQPPRPSSRVSALRRADPVALASAARERCIDDRALERALCGDLDWIVLRCLEKERSRRYETPNALAADLERFLASQPISARPPSTSYRLRKFVRRNRTGVTAATLVALALAAGTALALASYLHATREAERARLAENRSRLLQHLVRGGQASLAVLPLENRSSSTGHDFFVDGLTSTLIRDLASISALRVISDDSVMRFKGASMPLHEIAGDLHVDGIVTGSVEQAGDAIHIEVELTHALSDQDLFRATYEGALSGIRQLQSRIALDIAERLGLTIAPDERARLSVTAAFDPRAAESLARGKHILRNNLDKPSMIHALELIDQAISIEHEMAEAHAARAGAYIALSAYYEAPLETMPKARRSALAALSIDERNVEAHVMLGIVKFRFDYDYAGAAKEFERALELNASSAMAHCALAQYLIASGRFDEGLQRYEHALAIDPLAFLDIQDWFYSAPYNARRYDKAIEYAELAVSIEPEEWWSAWAWMGLCYAMQGRYEEALEKLQVARSLADYPMIYIFLGCVYADMGNNDLAWEMLAEVHRQQEFRYVCPFEIATVYIALGEYDEAFRLLDEALEQHSPCVPWFGTEPRLDPIRDDPRFPPLLERSGMLNQRPASSS